MSDTRILGAEALREIGERAGAGNLAKIVFADRNALLAHIEAMREVLASVEWASSDPLGVVECPACNAVRVTERSLDTHYADCKLNALLHD